MIPSGPVETYLAELRRQLPTPAPRLVAETREHLMEATSVGLASGLSQQEAETRATDSYGPVSDVVAAVLKEGSVLMSPQTLRWLPPFVLLTCMPVFVFVFVNVIESLAGNEGGYGVFGSTFDGWSTPLVGVAMFGPLIGLALILLASVRVHRDRGVSGFAATIEVRMNKPTVRISMVVALIAIAAIGYNLAQDPTGSEDLQNFLTENWACTISDAGQRICFEGNSLREP